MAENIEIKKVDGKSLDIEAVDKEKLKAVFPQCFSEGKLDIDKLLSLCGEYIDNDFEKYKFEWKGKSECYKIAGKRSTGTLRPCVQESVDFENTNNLYIEGDNLEVLKLLQNAYYRKVKMIYIDPPYNTGHDFVYEDDFKAPLAKYKEITSQTTKSNPETMGRYHTNWLNMMYPRLRLAANLLRDDGVIFISIDDNEVTNLRKLCDEVFGEENFVGCIARATGTTTGQDANKIGSSFDYLLCYRKSEEFSLQGVSLSEDDLNRFSETDEKGQYSCLQLRKTGNADKREDRPFMYYPVMDPNGQEVYPIGPTGYESRWRVAQNTYQSLLKNNMIIWKNNRDGKLTPYVKYYAEGRTKQVSNLWNDIDGNKKGSLELKDLLAYKVFDNPKPTELLKKILQISITNSSIILDFFSGSATTAHAVMQLNAEDGGNRQFIMVQLPELTDEKSEAYKAGYKNICEIGKERIRRAGAKIKAEHTKVDTGFKVFKLDTSNLVKWDDTPILDNNTQDLFTRMDDMVESIKTDRTELDVVYEVMLKLGIPATYKIFETQVNGRKVYSIGEDGLVLVCLDKSNGGITPEDITAMCDLAPAKIVAAENAFKDDVALSNAYYISKDKGIEIELL